MNGTKRKEKNLKEYILWKEERMCWQGNRLDRSPNSRAIGTISRGFGHCLEQVRRREGGEGAA